LLVTVVGTVPVVTMRLAMLAGRLDPAIIHHHSVVVALVAGTGIVCGAFLVAWAADVAQLDIAQSLAVALLALVAVLPEYSVDMYFAYRAGSHPGGDYGHYAVANMTGANRLLIGLGWPFVVAIGWLHARAKHIVLEKERRLELAFLLLATLYSFTIPFKARLGPEDLVIFIGLFVWYITFTARLERIEPELVGPAAMLGALPRRIRRRIVWLMFLWAAGVILASAEPFSESLVEAGKQLGIPPFFLVQWLAPLASESPEFTIAAIYAARGSSGIALGTLLSSKINQWTLLVGLIPLVFSAGLRKVGSLAMDHVQTHELFLTSAQSLFALMVLADMRFSLRDAGVLAVLFLAQMITQMILPQNESLRTLFGVVYIIFALGLLLAHRERREALKETMEPLRRK